MPQPEKEVTASSIKDNRRANWLKDGGRTIVFGGDPYEDDLESAASPGADTSFHTQG